jgi:YD repeat-containing protein
VTTYCYDALDRLTRAATKNSGGTTTDDRAYTYDGNGNRLSQTFNGTSTNYGSEPTRMRRTPGAEGPRAP